MNYRNEDGMLIVKCESGEEMLYFDDWLQVEYGHDELGVRAQYIDKYEGDEEMLEEKMEELEEQFFNYCDANGLIGETA